MTISDTNVLSSILSVLTSRPMLVTKSTMRAARSSNGWGTFINAATLVEQYSVQAMPARAGIVFQRRNATMDSSAL